MNERRDSPFKRAKHNRTSCSATHGALAKIEVRKEGGAGQEARKPEDHGEGFGGEDGVFVGGGGEEARAQGEVGDGERRGPDTGEDEEVDGGGGEGGFGGIPP